MAKLAMVLADYDKKTPPLYSKSDDVSCVLSLYLLIFVLFVLLFFFLFFLFFLSALFFLSWSIHDNSVRSFAKDAISKNRRKKQRIINYERHKEDVRSRHEIVAAIMSLRKK